MKPVPARVTRGLPIGAEVKVVDNSGAKMIKIIGVHKYRGVKRRIAAAGVGDVVVGTVKIGKPELRKQVVLAVIVRQRKEYQRLDGTRIKFAENAAILVVDDTGMPKATRIKGPVAKEVVFRFSAIGKLCSIVV